MAVLALTHGDMESLIIHKTVENVKSLISDGSLTSSDYNVQINGALTTFRDIMNDNFLQFADDIDTRVKAQGTLTVDTQPLADDTMTVGATEYTFVADETAASAGEIDVGADLADAQANIVAAINGTDGINTANASASIADFAADAAILTALEYGTDGNSIVTTETFDEATNIFDAGTLGTTTAGVDTNDAHTDIVQFESGDSWLTVRDKLNTNFNVVDAIVNA